MIEGRGGDVDGVLDVAADVVYLGVNMVLWRKEKNKNKPSSLTSITAIFSLSFGSCNKLESFAAVTRSGTTTEGAKFVAEDIFVVKVRRLSCRTEVMRQNGMRKR